MDHHATVEEIVDEDDTQNPPPPHSDEPVESSPPPTTNGTTMSAKAAGKQKASEKVGGINVDDKEAFPSLGAAKPATRSGAGQWSATPAVRSAAPNGADNDNSSRPSSSGVQTPTSTPGARTPSAITGVSQFEIPGRIKESIVLDKRDINPDKSTTKVIADARKKFNVAIESQSTGYGGSLSFSADGIRARSVTEALMYISKELTLDKTQSLDIPISLTAQIVGKAGANINKLQAQYNVKIQMGKEPKPGAPELKTVLIKGHAAGVRQVYDLIAGQVKVSQPKVDIPVREIPPEFFPFFAGTHGPRIQKMEQERELQINIPEFYRRQQMPPTRDEGAALFSPHGNSYIVISGDQAAARSAQQDLLRLTQQLQEQLILEDLTSEQILHSYIVGDKGVDPLDFLKKTGCAIILPPSNHDTDDIHIVGPRDKIEAGKAYANELMSKKHHRALDRELQKQFQDAPQGHERHSRALAQYLQQKSIERELLNSHNAEVLFPRNSSVTSSWNVISDEAAKAMAAKSELHKIAQAYPTSRVQLVEIDPFFHPHLEELHSDPFQGMGVHMMVPNNSEDPVVLVYEGPKSNGPFAFPRSKPTAAEIKQFEQALQQAEAQLMASIPHKGISKTELNIPRKHQDRVRKFTNAYPKPTRQNSFPVHVEFGPKKGNDSVFLRGPDESDIAALQKAIEEFLIEVEADEKERSHTTTFDFPVKFNKNLIGKGGQNINALREKHDVDIDTRDSGKVKITGPPKKAEACKAEILKTLKSWEDEVTYVLKVDPKFHGMLVGKNGENLRKLQTATGNSVRIDFPRATKVADDAFVADTASEIGGSRQASDEIKIRGPRAKADHVRSELLDLKTYIEDTSYTDSVSVDSKQISSLIGHHGAEVDRLRQETGCRIDFPKGEKGPRTTIQLRGTKKQVEAAKAQLLAKSKAFDSVVTKTIDVDSQHHKTLIGSGGSNIRDIVTRAGGDGSSAEHVRFPRQHETSNTITIKGTQEVVDKIFAELSTFANEKKNQVTEIVDVPISSHRNLIGAAGANRAKLEKDFGVKINIPKQGSGETGVKIVGPAENVAKAREHISSSSSGLKGETINVPRVVHHALDRDGAFKKELSKMGIMIDHEGHKLPKKPKAEPQTNGQMPLITDTPEHEVSHSWQIVPFTVDEEGEIPWTIYSQKKDEQALASAKKKIEEALQKASQGQVMGYLTLEDQGLHGRIVGKGGSTINGIRKESGCEVQVPKGGVGGDAITVLGSGKGVEVAYQLILDALMKEK